MKLNDLKPAEGSKKERRRKGRGLGSGRGKTAGRGQKGQKSRSGFSQGAGWEGGRSRLVMRLPKRGFTGHGEEYQVVNLSDLNLFDEGATVDAEALKAAGLISRVKRPVKLLGNGELEVKNLRVQVDAYSQSAVNAVRAAGGSAIGATSKEEAAKEETATEETSTEETSAQTEEPRVEAAQTEAVEETSTETEETVQTEEPQAEAAQPEAAQETSTEASTEPQADDTTKDPAERQD